MQNNLVPGKSLHRAASRIILRMAGLLALGHVAMAQKVTVEFDNAVDFTRFKTFAIRDGQLNSTNPALNSELTRKHIGDTIERALMAKGLMMVTGPSDLNIRYQFGTPRKIETEAYPAGWRGLGTRIVRVPYSEGTLVIDLRDPSTRGLVWRGIATQNESDSDKLVGKLDDMVKKSFDKYPPKK